MTVAVEIDESGEHISITADLRYKELCRTLPGSNWHKATGKWRMPVTWAACIQLRNEFGEALEVGPKLREWGDNEYRTRVLPSMELREALSLDEGDPDLFPHQRAGVKFLATAKQALLADEPGLGKSAQAVRALMELTRQGETVFPALVVCPNTLKENWQREFHRWWPDIRVQVIDGTAVQRRKQFATYTDPKEGELKPHVIVMNWEGLRTHSKLASYGGIALKRCTECGGQDPDIKVTSCEAHPKELNSIEFKAVIADEIHRSKDPKTAQSRALLAASGDAEVRFALTGTPQSKDVTDLWSIMHWVSPKEWPSKSKWLDRNVEFYLNFFGGRVVTGLKPNNSQEFFDILNPRMRRMLKKIVLPHLPPIVNQVRVIDMSAKQKKAYKQMEEFQVAELADGKFLVAKERMQRSLRQQQFAMAYAELEPDGEDEHGNVKYQVRMSEPSCTAEAIANDIINEDFGDSSVAVSAVSSQILELISARLDKANIPHGMITGDYTQDIRQNAIDAFQSGETKVILYTVQAGGVGVTLTQASVLCRAQIPYSLVDHIQGNDRVHRIGSEIHESILVVDYCVRDSIQYKAYESIEAKGLRFEEVVRDNVQYAKIMEEVEFGVSN